MSGGGHGWQCGGCLLEGIPEGIPEKGKSIALCCDWRSALLFCYALRSVLWGLGMLL